MSPMRSVFFIFAYNIFIGNLISRLFFLQTSTTKEVNFKWFTTRMQKFINVSREKEINFR